MTRSLVLLAFAFAVMTALPANAQVIPQPGADSPRIQRVAWQPGQTVLLTALPASGLTVMLEPGEQIQRIVVASERLFDIRVSSERDSFLVVPLVEGAEAPVAVQTDRREYSFDIRTGEGLMAALLVRFDYGAAVPEWPGGLAAPDTTAMQAPTPTETWSYRLRGDREVRPQAISDDGVRTRISFAPDQALPAIFAIGPTGDEEVVNGYMRDDTFVIDRVWQELVFRIDKDKATARRSDSPDGSDG